MRGLDCVQEMAIGGRVADAEGSPAGCFGRERHEVLISWGFFFAQWRL